MRCINSFSRILRSSIDRALSAPTTGRPFGFNRPTCTSTEAWSQYTCSCASLSPSNCTTTSITISTRWRWAGRGQDPVHSNRVGKPKDHLLDQPPLADGPRYRHHLRVGRDLGQKILSIKMVHRFFAVTANHYRDRVDVRVFYHRRKGLFGAMRVKFC